jgi:RNA polymerase sigma-70 factor (ECF subfamily)
MVWRVVNDDDRRLIADCLGGKRDAFGELVTRYQARLFNAALRLVQSPDDAADVVQDAFLSAYQALHAFKGDAEFFTWLYRIAFNTAISLKRKKRSAVSLDSQPGETGIDPNDPSEYVKPGAAIERSEDERQLSEAIARLSPEHREVLLLKDIEGLKYEDIAELLGVPIGTIRSRLHRARLELRALLVPLDERDGEQSPARDDRPEKEPLTGETHGGTTAANESETRTPPPNPARWVRRGD